MNENRVNYNAIFSSADSASEVENITEEAPLMIDEVEDNLRKDAPLSMEVGEEASDISEFYFVDTDPDIKLVLRDAPSRDGEVVDKLASGTKMKLIERTNSDWIMVSVNDDSVIGYVSILFTRRA